MYWLRRIHLFGLFSVLSVVAALSLSDAAPGTVDQLIRSAFVLANRIDPFGNIQHLSMAAAGARAGIPYGIDTIGHFVMWGGVGFLATGLFAAVKDRLTMLSALFLLSSLFEVGLQYLSFSRTAAMDDLIANGVGLLVGYTCYSIAEALAVPRLEQLAAFGARIRLSFTGRGGDGSLR